MVLFIYILLLPKKQPNAGVYYMDPMGLKKTPQTISRSDNFTQVSFNDVVA